MLGWWLGLAGLVARVAWELSCCAVVAWVWDAADMTEHCDQPLCSHKAGMP